MTTIHFRYSFVYLAALVLFFSCEAKKSSDVKKSSPGKNKAPRTKPLIIIDAGHGGKDPGGKNDSLKLSEKNITRSITDELIKTIDTNKITVVQTRPGDSFVNRHKRIEYANLHEPDFLLTIHINSAADSTYNGFEISYNDSLLQSVSGNDTINYANPHKEKLHDYCSIIQQKVSRTFPKMRIRGIKPRKDDIWMIYAPSYPSILFEFGYITSTKDAVIMKDKKQIEKLAEALKSSLYEILGVES